MLFETLTSLVTAHLIADFVLQSELMVRRKAQSRYLFAHIAIVACTAALAIGVSTWIAAGAVAIIATTHLLIDYVKVHYLSDTLTAFLIDQAAHLIVIAAVAAILPDLSTLGAWGNLPGDNQAFLYASMTAVSGAIVAVPLGGILIKRLVGDLAPPTTGLIAGPTATQPPNQITGPIAGMARGGKYIGWLERALTFILVLTGRVEGVGFLLAAKSILRLGDIKTPSQLHQTEYIIIGTFLSFGWALAVSMLTAKLAAYWHAF